MSFTAVSTVTAGNKVTATWGNTVHTATAELQNLQCGSQASSTVIGPTSGSTALTILSFNLPATGINGIFVLFAQVSLSSTVTSDRFAVQLLVDGVTQPTCWGGANGSSLNSFAVNGYGGNSGAATIPVVLQMSRNSGTGTASTSGSYSVRWIYIPAP